MEKTKTTMAKIKSVIAIAKGREMNRSQRHMRELLGITETSFFLSLSWRQLHEQAHNIHKTVSLKERI